MLCVYAAGLGCRKRIYCLARQMPQGRPSHFLQAMQGDSPQMGVVRLTLWGWGFYCRWRCVLFHWQRLTWSPGFTKTSSIPTPYPILPWQTPLPWHQTLPGGWDFSLGSKSADWDLNWTPSCLCPAAPGAEGLIRAHPHTLRFTCGSETGNSKPWAHPFLSPLCPVMLRAARWGYYIHFQKCFPKMFKSVTDTVTQYPVSYSTVLCLFAQLCLTLCDPMDCSPLHEHSPGKNTGVGCHPLLQGIFPTRGSSQPRSPSFQVDSSWSEPVIRSIQCRCFAHLCKQFMSWTIMILSLYFWK